MKKKGAKPYARKRKFTARPSRAPTTEKYKSTPPDNSGNVIAWGIVAGAVTLGAVAGLYYMKSSERKRYPSNKGYPPKRRPFPGTPSPSGPLPTIATPMGPIMDAVNAGVGTAEHEAARALMRNGTPSTPSSGSSSPIIYSRMNPQVFGQKLNNGITPPGSPKSLSFGSSIVNRPGMETPNNSAPPTPGMETPYYTQTPNSSAPSTPTPPSRLQLPPPTPKIQRNLLLKM